ncbi:MAG: hypothetical protein A3I77_03630 [Gammaproteobacteria bacterium RIFCSPLOWO2_02_FULL_42_14]|nr:MAG: hypothetical protein A3B71_04935 [Gammaproteobacteria bacterium RIFCSPHIGHO2_02_FULL_42_43]OGT27694.1 MAG: hypothetical protein A2624_01595 [Gammaproteobacteria bacterium RIFCSPHIGHO2_01_FULL_42_8]OGT51349.1 MAG: hypothetical protein A3E54_04700 [Gammaproteobacteria bacterium RIFCSPHIGHO2_12_FULL_41_25]OGT62051.1 MAG: hypothetical protein A3I77_03630 [Gammaproteobacteria bacterium RIFCSPLOWO2_02_FULL_42_14]OGT85724.1 MAG: hypothetical protein A3G86_03325 [Gammaproteobacteria bacterium R
MRRQIYDYLLRWKTAPSRMPLLVRGARQIGKTYVIESFAKKEFVEYLIVNFEVQPEYKACFSTLDPKIILERLEILSKKNLAPEKTLLFLDEIQECPKAIQALRYFKERYPALHVIGAGSLLEFTLNEAEFRMPVGRVEFLYMYPLNFSEFLNALGHEKLIRHLSQASITTSIDPVAHEQLLTLLKLFFVLGGMPAVVQTYIHGESLLRCQEIQAFLLNTYRNDFGKYASLANQQHCRRIFEKSPSLIAQHFKYSDIDPDVQSRSLKAALHLLIQAGLLLPVYETKATALPLNAAINEKKFKLLFVDIGFVHFSMQLNATILMQDNILFLNDGALAEQFVGQELIATQPNFHEPALYFWQQNQRNDSAEVDYIMQYQQHILPIEVKAGKTGRLRSLHSFMNTHKSTIGIKISQEPLHFDGKILSLPFYMISELNRIIHLCDV